VNVNPFSLDKVEISGGIAGKDILTFVFKLDPGIRPDALRLSPMRVYIHDDLPSALLIRKLLLCNVEGAVIRDDRGQSLSIDPRDMFTEGGFGEGDSLFPEYQNVSRPLSLLRDYFTFPEKFLFVDICGLGSLPRSAKPPSTLSLEVRFDRKMPSHVVLTKSTFQLYCAPAVNVFRRDAEPVLVGGEKSEYNLISDSAHSECYTIQSVESVTGIDSVTGERRRYGRFCRPGGPQRFYSLRRDRQAGGGSAIKILMNGRQVEDGRIIKESLHVETWQTNGILARKAAGAGGLRRAAPNFPDFITFSNITLPNNPINPPQNDEYLWIFISHLSATYSNFCDADKLKEFLYTYDWVGMGDKRPEVESILSVSLRPIDIAVGMAAVRGTEMKIAVDERAAPEEALFLFGTVLARALSCMSSINAFLRLVFAMSPSGKVLAWHCRSGEAWEV
jgi:type VI secretion system protein ImpG